MKTVYLWLVYISEYRKFYFLYPLWTGSSRVSSWKWFEWTCNVEFDSNLYRMLFSKMIHSRKCESDLEWNTVPSSPVVIRMSKAPFILPPEGNVLMLWLLSGRVKDTLPTVDLYTYIQLKVNVSLGCRATEAAAGWRARPALAEQLTHSRKPRGLPVRRLAVEKDRLDCLVSVENCIYTTECSVMTLPFIYHWAQECLSGNKNQTAKQKDSQGSPVALRSLALKLVLLFRVFGGGGGEVVAPHVVVLEGNGWEDSRGDRGTESGVLALENAWRKMMMMTRMGWLINGDWQQVLCLLRKLQRRTERQTHTCYVFIKLFLLKTRMS